MRIKLLMACLIAVVSVTIILPTLNNSYQTNVGNDKDGSINSLSFYQKSCGLPYAYAELIGGKCYVNDNNRLSYLIGCEQYCTSKYGQDVRASTCQNGCLNYNSLAVSGQNLNY